MADFAMARRDARSFAELEDVVGLGLGKTGLMRFMELDHGALLRKESGADTPKTVRLVIGNPLIMKAMVKHVPDAGSYARSRFSWMNGQTACISPMTKWPAFSRLTETQRRCRSARDLDSKN
jgi:hypothetical protein